MGGILPIAKHLVPFQQSHQSISCVNCTMPFVSHNIPQNYFIAPNWHIIRHSGIQNMLGGRDSYALEMCPQYISQVKYDKTLRIF